MVYSYSIGMGKRSQSLKNNNPGPGQYSPVNRSRQASPNWKMGTSNRQQWGTNKNPGPGQYKEPNFLVSQKEKSPSFYFGVKIIQKPLNTDIPGPGAYDRQTLLGKAPAFSLGGKSYDPISSEAQDKPGPGFYDIVNISSLSTKGIKVGTSKRDQYQNLRDTPGPGQYEVTVQKKETPMFSFGSNERKINYMSQTTSNLLNVGPGTYDLASTLRLDKGNTMIPKRQDNTLQLQAALPGPGAYEPQFSVVKKQLPLFKIGKSERQKSPTNNVPGPGKYDPVTTIVYQTTPNFRIGSSQRTNYDSRSNSPGPAAYQVSNNTLLDNGPKYSIAPKIENKTNQREKQQSPGPDRYNVTTDLTKEKSFAFKIGTSQRDFIHMEKNPGPGSYSPLNRNLNGTLYSFGKDSRIKSTYRDELPGPGAYSLKSFVDDYPQYILPKSEN